MVPLQAAEGCTAAGRAGAQGHPDIEESLDVAGAPRIRWRAKGLASGPIILWLPGLEVAGKR